MALFALFCLDKPNALELRMATRPSHVAYLQTKGESLKLAGPLLDAQGDMMGSMLVIEAQDLTAAQAFADADPYAQAGLFASVAVHEYRVGLGRLG